MRRAGSAQPFRTVFVATDFSPGGDRAVERAARLPFAPGGQLVVFHVVPVSLPSEMRAGAEAEARRAMDSTVASATRTARSAGNAGVVVKSVLASGDPASEIVLGARAESADLLALGRHARRALRDVFLGSTAHRVVRTADLPVLVVSGDPSDGYRRPLAAVDLEVPSRQVLDLLVRVLGPRAKTVELFHAFEVPFEAMAFPGLDATKLTRWGRKFRTEAERQLGEFVEALPDLGVRWKPSVLGGSASTAILSEAARRRSDLLALGTHGRSGLSRLLLGSVAERVLGGARCDVVVARPARFSRAMPPAPRSAKPRRKRT